VDPIEARQDLVRLRLPRGVLFEGGQWVSEASYGAAKAMVIFSYQQSSFSFIQVVRPYVNNSSRYMCCTSLPLAAVCAREAAWHALQPLEREKDCKKRRTIIEKAQNEALKAAQEYTKYVNQLHGPASRGSTTVHQLEQNSIAPRREGGAGLERRNPHAKDIPGQGDDVAIQRTEQSIELLPIRIAYPKEVIECVGAGCHRKIPTDQPCVLYKAMSSRNEYNACVDCSAEAIEDPDDISGWDDLTDDHSSNVRDAIQNTVYRGSLTIECSDDIAREDKNSSDENEEVLWLYGMDGEPFHLSGWLAKNMHLSHKDLDHDQCHRCKPHGVFYNARSGQWVRCLMR